MNKYAWITLLSTYDYLEAVLTLNRSLKKVKSKYPFVAACTPNITQNTEIIKILKKENIIIEYIPWLEYNQQTKENLSFYKLNSVFNVGAKIEIFGLNHYEKLIYLDADAFVVKNIDSLFKKKDGSALIYNNKCFCAMFVFSPKNHPLDFYKSILFNEVCNDGTLMEKLWWHVCDNKKYHIKNEFFYACFQDKILKRNVKAYHLQGQELKYWKMKYLPNTPLANLYKKYLFPIRKKYKEELKKIYINESYLFKINKGEIK